MVEFSGYAMPVQYADVGIVKSHLHTRAEHCSSLFDVSHMGQLKIFGSARLAFLEQVLVADLASMAPGQSKLSLITSPLGGIVDDCVVTLYPDFVYLVVNAGNKTHDIEYMQSILTSFNESTKGQEEEAVSMEVLEHQSLVALQGPGAAAVLEPLLCEFGRPLKNMAFMTGQANVVLEDSVTRIPDSILTRCGYTGEDGFEISVPSTHAPALAQMLLSHESVWPAGLGARDSLRLEAGLCLHGADISSTTTPAEGALMWTISSRRREEMGFPGAEEILAQFKTKAASVKRVGFVLPEGKPPARAGAQVFDGEKRIGVVTSGTISPVLKQPIGMASIERGYWKVGTEVQVEVRKKRIPMTIAQMPFVPTKYHQVEASDLA